MIDTFGKQVRTQEAIAAFAALLRDTPLSALVFASIAEAEAWLMDDDILDS